MSSIKLIPESEFKTTEWSGGTTTELFIWPEGASYAQRRFSARISTAAVDLEESVFTRLEGVKRFLTPLCAGFMLTVNGAEVELPYGKVLEFSGEDEVTCRGRGRDLNLMLKGADGFMEIRTGGFSAPQGARSFVFAPEETAVSYQNGGACSGVMLPARSFAELGPGDYYTPGRVVLFSIFCE